MQLLGSPNERLEEASYEAPRQQAAPVQPAPAPERPRQQPAPQAQAAAAPKQQTAAMPERRREPEPVQFESNSGDDDLPF